MKLRNVILSYDFVIAITTTLIAALFIPTWVKASFAASFYNTGITVLSIIFSLFFAALAIIMSSTDNEFIKFLEEKKHFTRLMASFKFTLVVLFISLIYSIVMSTTTDYVIKEFADKARQHKIFFMGFQFLFTYSLLATGLSVSDTISFTHYRTKFANKPKDPQPPTGGTGTV